MASSSRSDTSSDDSSTESGRSDRPLVVTPPPSESDADPGDGSESGSVGEPEGSQGSRPEAGTASRVVGESGEPDHLSRWRNEVLCRFKAEACDGARQEITSVQINAKVDEGFRPSLREAATATHDKVCRSYQKVLDMWEALRASDIPPKEWPTGHTEAKTLSIKRSRGDLVEFAKSEKGKKWIEWLDQPEAAVISTIKKFSDKTLLDGKKVWIANGNHRLNFAPTSKRCYPLGYFFKGGTTVYGPEGDPPERDGRKYDTASATKPGSASSLSQQPAASAASPDHVPLLASSSAPS